MQRFLLRFRFRDFSYMDPVDEWNSDICWCVRTETLAPLCDDDPCQDDEVVLPPEGAAATMTVCENDSPKSE